MRPGGIVRLLTQSDAACQIWTMLEIHLTGEDEEDAGLAAACLRDCCAALSSGERLSQLAELVLDEKRWTAWMTELQELAAADGVPSAKAVQKAASSVNSTCRALSAVAGAPRAHASTPPALSSPAPQGSPRTD